MEDVDASARSAFEWFARYQDKLYPGAAPMTFEQFRVAYVFGYNDAAMEHIANWGINTATD